MCIRQIVHLVFLFFFHKVCLPGMFLKLFTLCHELDLKMGSSLSSPMGMSATAYKAYSDALKVLSKFKEE